MSSRGASHAQGGTSLEQGQGGRDQPIAYQLLTWSVAVRRPRSAPVLSQTAVPLTTFDLSGCTEPEGNCNDWHVLHILCHSSRHRCSRLVGDVLRGQHPASIGLLDAADCRLDRGVAWVTRARALVRKSAVERCLHRSGGPHRLERHGDALTDDDYHDKLEHYGQEVASLAEPIWQDRYLNSARNSGQDPSPHN